MAEHQKNNFSFLIEKSGADIQPGQVLDPTLGSYQAPATLNAGERAAVISPAEKNRRVLVDRG